MIIILGDVLKAYTGSCFMFNLEHWFVYVWLLIHRQEGCYDEFEIESDHIATGNGTA